MSDDLIERLLDEDFLSDWRVTDYERQQRMEHERSEAAARIRELEAEVDRLRRDLMSARDCAVQAENERDDAKAELAALREGRGVSVKPLEWRPTFYSFEAKSIMGKYQVYPSDRPEYWLWRGESGRFLDQYKGKEPGPEAAKAAAQADYERRILSALSPAPVSVGDKPEEHCAKCGALRSNHPYRHIFVPAALSETEGE